MRVALVSPYDLRVPGGVQGQVLGLAEQLGTRGHDTLVLGPGRGIDGPVIGWPTNDSVAPIALLPNAWRQVATRVREADVVHVHEPFMPVVGLGALRSGVPTVATFHADPPPRTRLLYRRFAPMWRRRLGDALTTAVSDVAAEGPALVGASPRIVPNGVDVPALVAPAEGRDPVVLFLGRDEARKGLDDLVAAWQVIGPSLPEWQVQVVGATREALAGVRFLGRVDDETKRSLLERAAVLCAPNRRGESFGLVVAEGLAHGCAVVAADLPAFRAVAGKGASYVPPNDVEALAEALRGVCSDPSAREALVDRGRGAVARFSWDVVAEAYEAAYAEAIRGS